MMTNILKLNKLEKQQICPKTKEYDLGEQLCECLLKFENVWNNLFSNAFKFTPEGGKVTLVLESTEHHAIVKVRDTGCGMSPEVGAHIFEKFYQGDTSHAMQGNQSDLCCGKCGFVIYLSDILVCNICGVLCNHSNDESSGTE